MQQTSFGGTPTLCQEQSKNIAIVIASVFRRLCAKQPENICVHEQRLSNVPPGEPFPRGKDITFCFVCCRHTWWVVVSWGCGFVRNCVHGGKVSGKRFSIIIPGCLELWAITLSEQVLLPWRDAHCKGRNFWKLFGSCKDKLRRVVLGIAWWRLWILLKYVS